MNKITLYLHLRTTAFAITLLLLANVASGNNCHQLSNNFLKTWDSGLTAGKELSKKETSKQRKIELMNQIRLVRESQGEIAKNSTEGTKVIFGVSGWRARIGKDFSAANVRRVVKGIIETLKSDEYLNANNIKTISDLKKRGIVLLRDNRYLGEEFLEIASDELTAAGITVHIAGECPTGIGSIIVTKLKAAGSINFTPSHNTMDFQGLKFNPADGGPAPELITKKIEYYSNKLMDRPPQKATHNKGLVNRVDAKKIAKEYFEQAQTIFNLDTIRSWLLINRSDLFIAIDNMHGASRGYIEAILGRELIEKLKQTNSIVFKHTNNDFSFHGAKPEPSSKNQAEIIKLLRKSQRHFTIGAALDPDGDRIRLADKDLDINMNKFGPLIFKHLLKKGEEGGLATTVSSSAIGKLISKESGTPYYETAVGFKYFRDYLIISKLLIAFEESDGITFKGHTLEKDGIGAFFLAIDSIIKSGKNLSKQWKEIEQQYGYFYPARVDIDVPGLSIKEWELYKKKTIKQFKSLPYNVGDKLLVNKQEKVISEIYYRDGLKIVFKDHSWVIFRPSGTEPQLKIHFELISNTPVKNISKLKKNYIRSFKEILKIITRSI